MYEKRMVGGPSILLLTCLGAAQSFVKEKRLGITVLPRDVPAIQEAIQTASERGEVRAPMRTSKKDVDEFDRKTAPAEKLATVLSSLRL